MMVMPHVFVLLAVSELYLIDVKVRVKAIGELLTHAKESYARVFTEK